MDEINVVKMGTDNFKNMFKEGRALSQNRQKDCHAF
jgi:hypothetical protein